jgi:TalC/MipB family fructose-6-phosphate aldolase
MKFFIDTADVNEIREASSWGLVDGVTTNPRLMSKTGRPYAEVLREICEIVDGPISAEVVATEASAMLEEGEKLARIHPNIVVKCPPDCGRPESDARAVKARHQGERHADLHAAAGDRGGQMRRDLPVTVRRKTR